MYKYKHNNNISFKHLSIKEIWSNSYKKSALKLAVKEPVF